ncbi:hypothetical protein RhiirA1_484238, partial [Rhizophagus irregularis]
MGVVIESIILEPKFTKEESSKVIIEDEELELKKIKRKTLIGQVTLGILIVALWEILTRIGVMDSYYWSSPQIILQTSWVAITE